MPRTRRKSRKTIKREFLFHKQNGLCGICGHSMRWRNKDPEMAVTLDHIIPRRLGGGNELFNLRAAHKRCNERRGSDISDLVTGLLEELFEEYGEES